MSKIIPTLSKIWLKVTNFKNSEPNKVSLPITSKTTTFLNILAVKAL